MQTFLPFKSFKKSMRHLDYRRLGKQRTEAWQLYRMIYDPEGFTPWRTHPAYAMWFDYPDALLLYTLRCCEEWERRGYRNVKMQKVMKFARRHLSSGVVMPDWLGDEDFHSSHRAALLWKSEFYDRFNWPEEPIYDYVWPVQDHDPLLDYDHVDKANVVKLWPWRSAPKRPISVPYGRFNPPRKRAA